MWAPFWAHTYEATMTYPTSIEKPLSCAKVEVDEVHLYYKNNHHVCLKRNKCAS